MISKVLNYIRVLRGLLRVKTYYLIILYYLVGYLIFDTSNISNLKLSLKFCLSAMVIALWYINGTSLNDYADQEIDKINLKKTHERPLLEKAVSRKQILVVSVFSAAMSLIFSLMISKEVMLVTTAFIFLNIIYSLKPFEVSHKGELAILLLPLGYVVFPILLGVYSTGNTLNSFAIVLICALYLQFISRIILKDYRDVKGDARFGKKTFLLKYGNKLTCRVAQLSLGAGIIVQAYIFYTELIYILIGIFLLSGYCFEMLSVLMNKKKWSDQKAYISSIGRAQTGNLVITGLSLDLLHRGIHGVGMLLVSAIVGGVFLRSARMTLRLSRTKA